MITTQLTGVQSKRKADNDDYDNRTIKKARIITNDSLEDARSLVDDGLKKLLQDRTDLNNKKREFEKEVDEFNKEKAQFALKIVAFNTEKVQFEQIRQSITREYHHLRNQLNKEYEEAEKRKKESAMIEKKLIDYGMALQIYKGLNK
jgi:hypothetical protein